MKLSRRDFLIKGTAMFATLGLGEVLLPTGGSIFAQGAEGAGDETLFVSIYLDGGNDGLNTLIPYAQGTYYDARPTLAYKQSDVLALDNQVGLHPKLVNLKKLYDNKKLAIVQGVGYPNPNLSHFHSMDVWRTAQPEKVGKARTTSWISRYIQSSLKPGDTPLTATKIGGIYNVDSYHIFSPDIPVLELNRFKQAFNEIHASNNNMEQLRVIGDHARATMEAAGYIQSKISNYVPGVQYPDLGLANSLQGIVKLMACKTGTRVFTASQGGFDDHHHELYQHAKLLGEVDQSIGAFVEDLDKNGFYNRVAVLVYSEFGRKIKENGNQGTDHGTAQPVFVFGGRVKGGLYGAYPSLTNLDGGDMKCHVDFRSVYSTILESWLKGDTQSVLGKTYENLKIF
ncbi:hypothetical protein GCM10008018_14030 [Paenibacillus marchantiophytorum]|uniref:DUF1501 domain-containing protein n=1 Tax=Paenibacillus marchantiophytorum TaxID=1619310 RepID=A0ABQ2BRH5_9BACL|nr:DUF1501 domain-containing protein [Paenibacillus marchantiophytorum]GGI45819.1 hypothetical protein GCM10008018_14030 [Paenibacillus marchantiophytorum]